MFPYVAREYPPRGLSSGRIPSRSLKLEAISGSLKWPCKLILLVQPHGLGRPAVACEFFGAADHALEVPHGEVGPGEPADEAHRRNPFRRVIHGRDGVLEQGSAIPAERDR